MIRLFFFIQEMNYISINNIYITLNKKIQLYYKNSTKKISQKNLKKVNHTNNSGTFNFSMEVLVLVNLYGISEKKDTK